MNMGHKITVTGTPVSPLRSHQSFFSFDMEEGGSPSSPKGLPSSSTVTFTVYLNQKQLNKAGLTKDNLQTQRIMVQGELTLDMPIEECPGEMGVIGFQVSLIPDKTKKAESEELKTTQQVAAKPKKKPKGTKDFIALEKIIVPEAFLKTSPNREKTQRVLDYVKKHGTLDEPLRVDQESYELLDGYRRYLVAQTLNMDLVPVAYESVLKI